MIYSHRTGYFGAPSWETKLQVLAMFDKSGASKYLELGKFFAISYCTEYIYEERVSA